MRARRLSILLLCLLGCAAPPSSTRLDFTAPHAPANFPPFNPDGTLNALIEIPAGTNAKWEATADHESLEWERLDDGTLRVVAYLAYPANYGMVPGTLLDPESGGDGDPLDVLVLGPALPRGAIVRVRLIGALALRDDGEIDDKLLAVPEQGTFAEIDDVRELDERYPGVSAILATWFGNYKGPGRIEVLGLRSRAAATEQVKAATRSDD